MDGNAAIERNREALIRILATLVAMAGLSAGEGVVTLPRRVRLAVLGLLRPAESATRRLIIALARGLVVTLPLPRPRKPKPKPTILVGGVGTGILMPPAAPGDRSSSRATPQALSLPIVDPLRRPFRKSRPARSGVPRICVPGLTAPFPVAARRPPTPHDPVDGTRLRLRLDALARALDDLPGQARRFARWRARGQHSRGQGLARRLSPLRPGRPPGGRLSRYDPLAPRRRRIREVDEVLAHAHALAVYALEQPDTS